MRSSRVVLAAAGFALASSSATAQGLISLKSGESADLHAVYWVNNCKSVLRDFVGVTLLEGPSSVKLSIRKQDVTAVRQNCKEPVPGGIVVVSVGQISAPFSGEIKYRVTYRTIQGEDTQSSHSRKIALYP